jgi:NIMA (never in mitosis gene a)-related kinase
MEDADGEGNKASGHNLLNERTIYGDYEVIKPIGKGKFAVVYRARRISDNETVALKRISVDSVDAKAREKCLKEVKLLQSLDHPNVIKYLDSFITDDDLVIIVEWAAAGDLKRQLRKAQERGIGFEERVIWKYFSQMCQAMQHLREKRIMHRDLKPANIFLTLDGRVKVGDLGLSRELSEHTVQAHSKVGTPLYMSPEVLRGDGYDFKSDIWSLGCLLYELAMLKSPFKSEGLNLYSLFQKISQGDYQPLPENYSEKLRNLAYSMISIKSEDRPEIGDVCRIANEMRQLTNEKQGSSNPKKKDDVSVNGNSPIDRTDAKNIDAKETVSRDNTATVVPVVNDKNDEFSDRWNVNRKTTMDSDSKSNQVDSRIDSKRVESNHKKEENAKVKPINTTWDYLDEMVPESEQTTPVKVVSRSVNNTQIYTRPKLVEPKHDTSKSSKVNNQVSMPESSDLALDIGGGVSDIPGSSDKFKNTSSAFSLCEIVYSRLIVLGCPLHDISLKNIKTIKYSARGTLLPFHFAIDLNSLGKISGMNGVNSYFQFRRMTQVAMWLCNKIHSVNTGVDSVMPLVSKIDLDNDTPLMIAKQLIGVASSCGVEPIELAELTPTSLSLGYGERVCTFLMALTDKLMKTSNFKAATLLHRDDTEDVDSSRRMQPASDDEEDDIDIVEDSEKFRDDNSNYYEKSYRDGDDFTSVIQSVLHAQVDPVLWREEAERVAVLLTQAKTKSIIDDSYINHLQSMKNYVNTSENTSDDVTSSLRAIQKEVVDTIASVKRNEAVLNSKYSDLCREYAEHQHLVVSNNSLINTRNENVSKFTNFMSELDAKYDEIRDQLDSKVGGDNSGTSQLTKVKDALKTLKDDIKEMDLTTGIICNRLFELKKNKAKTTRKKPKGTRNRKLRDEIDKSGDFDVDL